MTENDDQEVTEKCVVATNLSSVTENEKEMAQKSAQEFEKGNYEGCQQILQQLLKSRPSDPKVLHNKYVTEFYQSGLIKLEEFKKNLNQVCNQSHLNMDDDCLDDVDHCVVYYNQAILLYHQRQYYAAIAMLDKVFHFIEPIEEALAKKVCFLLLELYLCTFQMDKGLGLIGYTETLLFGNNTNKSQSPEKDKQKNGKESSLNNKENSEASSNEIYRSKLQQYKARLYIMSKSMKFCKREIKSLMNSIGVNTFTVYLKSNLEYLRGNYRKALKVLNTAPHSEESLDTGENTTMMYYNNVACIHFYMGKPHLGCFYFQKALQENENTLKRLKKNSDNKSEEGISLPALGASRHYELLFNLGIQFLHAHRPLPAFDCLIEAIQMYPTNPRLWLRLAECCVMVHKSNNATDFQISQRHKDIVQGIVGAGAHRKIILSPGLSIKTPSSETQSAAMPMPTLEFASLCLKNALFLLHEDGQPAGTLTSSVGSDETECSPLSADSGHYISGLPGNPIKGAEVASLRTSVLVTSAYVSLCLGDIVMALYYADTLLAQQKLCGIYKLLGHLYAGEALILLDRISDAIQHFNPDLIKDVPLTLPNNEKEEKEKNSSDSQQTSSLQGWFPNSLLTAQIIMQYNLTVAFALRGEYEKASEALRQIGAARGQGTEVPIQAVMLAMYIQLQQGHADLTKNIVKQYIPQLR